MDPNKKRLLTIGLGVLGVIAIFVIGAIVVGGGGSGNTAADTGSTLVSNQPVTVTCIGGSEKTALMADPQVQKILRDKYGG